MAEEATKTCRRGDLDPSSTRLRLFSLVRHVSTVSNMHYHSWRIYGVVSSILVIGGLVLFLMNSRSSSTVKLPDSPIRESFAKSVGDGRSSSIDENFQLQPEEDELKVLRDRMSAPMLLGADLILTTPTIRAMRLSDDEAVQLQGRLNDWIDDMTTAVKENTKYDNANSHDGRHAFTISAFPDRSASLLEALHKDVETLIGETRTEVFVEKLSTLNLFSELGKYGVNVAFVDADPKYEYGIRATYVQIDPTTGSVVGNGDVGYEIFKKRFGDIFVVVDDDDSDG